MNHPAPRLVGARLARFGVFLLLAFLTLSAASRFALAEETGANLQWVLNHGPAMEKVDVSQGSVNSFFGVMQLQPSGTDLTMTFPMPTPFAAEEYPIFAMRYRMKTNQKIGGLFFTTDTLTSLSDESFSPFSIVGDDTWRHLLVDMRTFKHGQWKGTVKSFRLDPTNPSDADSMLEISRIGFFPNESDAEAFLGQANDEPDFSMESILYRNGWQCLVPGGVVNSREDVQNVTLVRSPELLEQARKGTKLTVCRNGEPVPAYVNGCGYAWFIAEKCGKYELAKADGLKTIPLPKDLSDEWGCTINSPFPPEYFTRDRIRIGGWALSRGQLTTQKIQDFRDCGFDFLIGVGSESSNSNRALLLNECDRLGIEVVMNDGAWIKPETAGESYFDHPSFCGHYLTDEPGTDAYDKWGKYAAEYSKVVGKTPYINLLPMYANAAQLKFGASAAAIEYYDSDPDLYRKYCESYCDKIQTSYICTDIYPLNWVNGRRVTYNEYVESINVIASVARERKRDFWCFIQTFGWIPSKRTPNAPEFRWQCYSMLSFGCRGILCWVYCPYKKEFPSLVDMEGNKTAAWYDAQTVFGEVAAISDIFCTYENLGAFTHNASDEVPYLKMSNEYKNFETIQEVICPDPLLIGCFQKEKSADVSGEPVVKPSGTAFTLVNMKELDNALSTLVKLRLRGEKVTVYRKGMPKVLKPEPDGTYAFPLETGEGVFVTVD